MMDPKEFAEKMKAIADERDTERGHIKMDDLMCELLRSLGYGDGIDIFDDVPKWYA